jgi:hypothetical protein
MSQITVRKSFHMEMPSILIEALVQSLGYVSAKENILMEHVTQGLQRRTWFTANKITDPAFEPPAGVIRRSDDNGKSWRVVEEWASYRPRGGKDEYFYYSPVFVPHPRTGQIVRFYTRVENVKGLFPWDEGSPWLTSGKIYSQHSGDGGAGWSEPKQVVMSGGGCDETRWAPDITYGVNGGGVEGVTPMPIGDGKIIIPSYSQRTVNGKRRWRSSALIGTWRGDGDDIAWQMTAYSSVGPHASGNGGDEPSIVRLPDGRLLMTMRVRTDPNDGSSVRSGKFTTTSRDLGTTWAEPEILRYDDGSQVLCPASLANIFISSKTHRLYIITNILAEPTWGCRPRFTLQIAEMDMATLRIIRESVTVIDTNDTSGGKLPMIDFSNWRWYEDRITGDIVMVMTGCPGDKGRSETCGVPPHSYRYDLTLS